MNHEEYKNWLSTLKVGDQVAVSNRWVKTFSTYTIKRETATLFIGFKKVKGIEVEVRFKKGSGFVAGTDQRIQPITQQVIDTNEHANLASWLVSVSAKKLTTEQLKAMRDAFEKNGGAA